MVRIRAITSLRSFDAMASVWREVTREGGQESPFLSHDWFTCCWRALGSRGECEVWMVEDTVGPVAFVPLMRTRERAFRMPVRAISLLESPDTPFADIPMAGSRLDVLRAVLDALRDRRDWDVLWLRKLPAESRTLKALESMLPGRFRWRTAGRENSPYVSIDGDWQHFLGGRTPRFRKTCRNIENRIRSGHVVAVEEHRDVDPGGPIFRELMGVSARSWKAPRGFAVATMTGMPLFFRELTRRAGPKGWLHLWILRLDGRAVATEYQIGSNGRLHALRAEFDAELEELSPGAGLNIHIVRSLFEKKTVAEYDMGPGANPYKVRWATGAHDLVTLEIYATTPRGRMLHLGETRIKPFMRRWQAGGDASCA